MDSRNNKTEAWALYEKGRSYNNRLVPNYYRMVNANIEFFCGNQWLNIPDTPAMSRLPKPTFNIIKRIAGMFIAFLTSSGVAIRFEPLAYYDGNNISDPDSNAASFATAEVENLFEKFGMDYRVREALTDGVQTGDYCAHFFWNPLKKPYGGAFGNYKGEIEMELVDGVNVMFGNPNTPDVQSQPYILVIGRDTVDNLREEARQYRKGKGKTRKFTEDTDPLEDATFMADNDYTYQAATGGRTEIEADDHNGKALYIYMYTKVVHEEDVTDPETGEVKMEPQIGADGAPVPELDENGNTVLGPDGEPAYKMQKVKELVTSVHVTKATKSAVIYEDVDTGMSLYPISWGNWEHQKNQYHGRALATGIIPNQIAINTLIAMAISHQMKLGFPTILYNANMISQWDNTVGKTIGVRNLQPNQSINQVATTIAPADMSAQIIQLINTVMSMTRECLGATDVQMGNVEPENTSAIMVLQSNSQVPLENPRACLHEWIEDTGSILLDMMGTYYGERPIVRERSFEEPVVDPATNKPVLDPMTGQMRMSKVTRKVVETYDFSQFKHLWLNVRCDVGATTYFSEIAMTQTLDNLRKDGTLDIIDYLERIPDKLIPKKDELIEKLKDQLASQSAAPALAVGQDGQTQSAASSGGASGKGSSTGGVSGPIQAGKISAEKTVANLPTAVASKYNSLPTVAKNALATQASLNG